MQQEIRDLFKRHKKRSLELRSESIKERKEKLRLILKWLYANREHIADAIGKDLAKPIVEVELSEILPVTSEIKLALSQLHNWARPQKTPTSLLMIGTRSIIHYEPKGTALIIAPWNYPLNLTLSPLVSAIAAGNTAIIKPSERTPHTSELLSKMLAELFNEDEVTVIQGGIPETQALLEQPFDHIFFTGSPSVGKIVMTAAAKNLTSVTLELGGKSPAVVDATANVKDAARKLTWGKFTNCGQTCIAPDYILVHASKFDELKEHLIAYTEHFYNNKKNGFDKSEDYSGIVDERHVQHLDELVSNATKGGANVALGGFGDMASQFFAPTLLTDVSPSSKLMEDEIFGPILPIITFSEIEEAIEIINSKPKPLALYLFTQSKKHQKQIIAETSSGGVNINDNLIQFSNLNIPFGGVNNSGIGKSHGYHGFLAFSNEKPVMKQRVGLTGLTIFYPPYTKFVKQLVRKVVDLF